MPVARRCAVRTSTTPGCSTRSRTRASARSARCAASWKTPARRRPTSCRPRASDGLPVIGESAEVGGLFYAAGYYRNGILLAPASGELVADLVTGRATRVSPRVLSTFSPARFRAAHAGTRGK